MTEEENKIITREKHPERVAQAHKPAALMKKRKKEILRSKEVYSTAYTTAYRSLQCSLQYKLQYSQMILMSIALVYLLSLPSVFMYFLHIRLKIKKTMIAWRLSMSKKNKINHQNDVICFRKNIQ